MRTTFIDVSKAESSEEALELAGLNWSVKSLPLRAVGPAGEIIPVPGQNIVYRADTNKPLGIVGARYKALDNARIFSVADDIVRVTGGRFQRAISLGGGRRVALQILLPKPLVLGKDLVERLFTLVDTRDGSTGTLGFITPTRLACFNALRMALERATSKTSIRHTIGSQQRLEEASRLVARANTYFDEFSSAARALNAAPYSVHQMNEMVELLIPTKAENPTPQCTRVRGRIAQLFETGIGHQETGIQGTAWAALNAVAEFVDHERSTRASNGETQDERRLESAYFGNGQTVKDRALAIIRTQTGV
jgi:phage/plasmid-like protein (TIGR03299 family)